MNWLDIVILIVIAWFTLTSLRTGLIREIMALVGFVAGIYLAGQFYLIPAAWLHQAGLDVNLSSIAGFAVVLVVVWVAASLLASLLHQVANLLFLGWLNHLGGGLFGLLRGLVIVEILIIIAARYPVAGLDKTIQASTLGSFFLRSIPFVLELLPGEFDVLRRLPLP